MSRKKINNFTNFGIFLSNRKQKCTNININRAFCVIVFWSVGVWLGVDGIKKALPL
jgi:hypothetical protein